MGLLHNLSSKSLLFEKGLRDDPYYRVHTCISQFCGHLLGLSNNVFFVFQSLLVLQLLVLKVEANKNWLIFKIQRSLQIYIYIYIGHPYLITALFEIGPVAYFGLKQDTFDQKTILFLLQCGITF